MKWLVTHCTGGSLYDTINFKMAGKPSQWVGLFDCLITIGEGAEFIQLCLYRLSFPSP